MILLSIINVFLFTSGRCNTSLLIDFCEASSGNHNYILIDVGKSFREAVLRWFVPHRIPRLDSVSSSSPPFHLSIYSSCFYVQSFNADIIEIFNHNLELRLHTSVLT